MIVNNKSGLAVFVYRNRMWRLEKFITFGIGGKSFDAALDGFRKPLSQEDTNTLTILYKKFRRRHMILRILFRRKAGYLNEDQYKACVNYQPE
jgi:hypothetical protein